MIATNDCFDTLIEWYNNRRQNSLNLQYAETPNQAFIRKILPEVCGCG